MMAVVAKCQNEPVEFKISGTELDFIVGKTSVSMLDDIPLIEVQYNISSSSLKFIKRLFDLAFGLFVLFFIYPFIYLISKLSKDKSEFRSFILSVPSVVAGKKSFVGPQKINSGKTIFMGKQGLTGFWKLENNRDVELEKLDFYYAKNQNIWLDIDILGRTINKMWSSKEK
jgi:lipopolysaccharide/colanic/teichoic acid biosynthesis glycosyltransferase